MGPKPDFSGYATKAGLKCSDGLTITAQAFQHMDGQQVPLVWQHGHNNPQNVLGHARLEARTDGVYAHGFFNSTKQGQDAKILVQHGDIESLSIYANQLQKGGGGSQVLHGNIREVSLVIAGANPGAKIDFVAIQHGDDSIVELDDEAVITTGLTLEHSEPESDEDEGDEEPAEDAVAHAAGSTGGKTIQDIYDSLSEEQKQVVQYMIGAALDAQTGGTAKQSDTDEDNLSHQEGTDMTRNIFEQGDASSSTDERTTLSHSDVKEILGLAQRSGSLKHAINEYAISHGVENIDLLFPDAKALSQTPEFIKRETEWVAGVINGVRSVPFSRIKNFWADITFDEARARGYVKGNFKKEEFFKLAKRSTSPTTFYKKQKLDRDDIIDVTDFDFVAWLKAEMRLMLNEEVARAILIGDGRAVDDEDKIKDPIGQIDGQGIRSIANEDELFATTVWVNIDDANSSWEELVDTVELSKEHYKGSGTPTFYTTQKILSRMLLTKDKTTGRRMWRNAAELASEMGVDKIVPVEVMENQGDLLGIIVNLTDYAVGTDRGGEVTMFDDFDIDYNTYKYLMEGRCSGALAKMKSALVLRKTAAANVLVDPVTEPTFNVSTNVVTIPSQTGVTYKNGSGVTLTAGPQAALTAGQTLDVVAVANSGYYFMTNADDAWSFKYVA